ncbi:hypothetical protein [Streptomyces sp. bgisy034]|uniref:hypothetical protein n=1 Tax=Streptomyces sp. bgisy034 TaxID=3413774 RepID=UPI003EBEE39C
MPTPAERRPRRDTGKVTGATGLLGLAGLACAACCLLPVLITAGVVGGTGVSIAAGRLPALAAALAALAAATWWLTRRRFCSCTAEPGSGPECGCGTRTDRVEITTSRAGQDQSSP